MMDREWNDSQPIYRQLRDRVVAMILDGVLNEGDPLPSVRNVAADYRGNPLTVLKAHQHRQRSDPIIRRHIAHRRPRSEEHTSELQSRQYLVCRLLPETEKPTSRKP